MAELEVRDGGQNPAVPAEQRAFTIKAVNNGPDAAPEVEVTLTGLDAGSCTGTATEGELAFSSGECVWTIGELKTKEVSEILNGRDGEILTIITSAAVNAEITAEIENTQDYQVCIDSSGNDVAAASESACTDNTWHTTEYYDYIDGNNSATIKAMEGTGADLPSLQSAQEDTASIVVVWDPVVVLNNRLVTHYEVEWSADGETGWTKFSDKVTSPRYVDTGVEGGETRYYRVRAVNDRNHEGPWSQPIRAKVFGAGLPGVAMSKTTLTLNEGESGDYMVKLLARPVSSVTVNIGRGGDVSPNPSRLTFISSNWNTFQTVTLTAGQDNDAVDDTVEITHTVSSSDAEYRGLTVDPVAVTVIDDDSGVSIAAEHASVNEGDAIALTLTRTGNTGTAITVTVNVSQSGDYLASGQAGNRTVDLQANTTSTTIIVETENDTTVEGQGSVFATVLGGASYFASSPSSATVRVQDDDGPPGQPGNLTAVEGDEQVALSWSAAPTGDAPVLEYSYRVRRSDSSAWDPDWTIMLGSSVGTRDYTVHNLTNGQEYVIQVRARNATGDGAAAEVTASPLDEPGPPEVTVSSRNDSLLVTWSVPDDGGRPTTEYRVQWKSGGESFDSSREATATALEHTIPSLINGTEYRVRVQAMNEAGWGGWSGERPGTPTPRPATSLSITTEAVDGVDKPFRVTFTFTDEDHDGTQYGVTGFGVNDIVAWYSSPTYYEFTLQDFREERPGLVYSALVNQLLDGNLRVEVPAGVAESTHDEQESLSALLSIEVEPPQANQPAGTEIWSAVMTVGDLSRNAMGYINPDLTLWDTNDTIGSLSDGDDATDDDDTFTYLDKAYTVGELTIVPDWNTILLISCPGLEGADASFDLFLDDQVEGNRDHSLSFDPDEVDTYRFSRTIDGVTQSCVEYRWTPHRTDWEEGGQVNVRIVR